MRLLVDLLLVASSSVYSQSKTVSIVFTADMPIIGQDEHGSYAQLATAVNHYRSHTPDTLFLFGGNSLGPSPMSSFDSGSHIVDILNGIEPSAMGITKREYSYYEEQLSLRAYEAAFPMVATNIFDPLQGTLQDGLLQSLIIEKGGISFGIMAVIAPKAKQQYLLKRVVVQNIANSIRQETKRLKNKGAEYTIVMHGTLFPEIDELLEQGVVDMSLVKDPFAPLTALKQADLIPNKLLLSGQGEFAVAKVRRSSTGSFELSWQRESLSDYDADVQIAKLESDYVNRLDRLMELPIATVKHPFDTYRNKVRTEENQFANVVTDAMVEYTGADIAIINSGGIRGDTQYTQDQLFTRKDLVDELPFRAGVITIEISGAAIKEAIEAGVSEYQLLRGKFPQVSNLSILFDSRRPAGSRVIELKVKGDKIDTEKLYKVATTDYLYNGGDGYKHFTKARLLTQKQGADIVLSDLILYSILKKREIGEPLQKRIINLGPTVRVVE
ncbi:bifunctional metallophosphatase/5'-nucleotidase [Aliiglaciecola sp.]|nr:bifunctional metallophosphatase/5'-nucleotidase [Aliiglaciecola sp.]